MPCYQSTNLPGGVTTTGRTSYTTEADCNNACKEGACCEGTTCTVKPQCQCQGTGKTFKGVGTTCTPNPCLCCCEFYDMRTGGVMITQNDSACIAINNKRIYSCYPTPLVISVSGVATASVPSQPAIRTDFSFANTSRATAEVCGQSGLYVEDTAGYPAEFLTYSPQLQVYAWFSPYDSLKDVSSERCSQGSVRLRIQLNLSKVFGSYGSEYVLEYSGYHKGDCTSLDSYPSLSSMLAGKTVTMTCDGALINQGSRPVTYAADPQAITVSFAANPLP